jgi:hypothetical protein
MSHSYLKPAIIFGHWNRWNGKPVPQTPLFYESMTKGLQIPRPRIIEPVKYVRKFKISTFLPNSRILLSHGKLSKFIRVQVIDFSAKISLH